MPELNKWYKTSDGFNVQFIIPIEEDGMYNVFRHDAENDFMPYYTDSEFKTAYGTHVIIK